MGKNIIFYTNYYEIDFLIDILDAWIAQCSGVKPVLLTHSEDDVSKITQRYPYLAKAVDFALKDSLPSLIEEKNIGLLLTSEQFHAPIKGIKNICCFHGQPAKGHTLTPQIDKYYQYFFLLGPFQRAAIETYYINRYGALPRFPKLLNIGQTNKEQMISGFWNREQELEKLGLDPHRKTILYAPAFNAGGSLREFGPKLVEHLQSLKEYNLIIKLSVDNHHPATDMRCNGGTNWFDALSVFEKKFHYPYFKRFAP